MVWLACFAAIKGLVRNRSESRLVTAAQKSDPTAFDQLVSENSPSLKRFIARRVNQADRDDILQETWLAAWENLSTFDGSCRFRTWVYAICFHKIQDYWRREQCRPPTGCVHDAMGATAYLPPEFAGIDLRESMREMWEAYSPEQRDLLRMYYADGLTLNEISRILGRNLNTVKYQFYRAHEVAAKMLPDDEGTEILREGVRA
jgi:RNA polymerase sigma-70 factor, ECF subfamily